ncbi:MAG: fluoride efflux transporter CrcB [Betaproteobacteria bacterium]
MIGLGASLGAWLRWGLSAWLNPRLPSLPLGTLTSNLVGGYLVGIAVAYFSANSALAPEWRLLAITGFLGGLTTFSTFSAEVVLLLQADRFAAAALLALVHLIGSLLLTVLGFATYRALAT